MRKHSEAEHFDLEIAMSTARVFVRNAERFARAVRKWQRNKEAGKPTENLFDIGSLVASATELCFAIELYLKSIWIRLGLRVPETHNLWTLFKQIPLPQFAELVGTEFEHRCKRLPKRRAGLVQVILSTHELPDPTTLRQPSRHQRSIKEILIYCGDGFTTWRYLYEKGRPGGVFSIDFPFSRLAIIAKIFDGINSSFGTSSNPTKL